MRKIPELIRLKYQARLSHEQIARALPVSKGVVAKYVARIAGGGLAPEALLELSESDLRARLMPASRPHYGGRVNPDYAHVHAELRRPGVTLMLLWQEYVAEHADAATYRYSQFAERYRLYVASLRRSMRHVHRAGEKLFVDYAGRSVPYGADGARAQVFVAVLGASNYTFACATAHQSLEDWTGALVRALEYIEGVPALIVPDNARALIADPDRYEPRASATIADLAAHYGTAVLPARPYRPRDKAKVEVAVQIVERWILARLRHRSFATFEASTRPSASCSMLSTPGRLDACRAHGAVPTNRSIGRRCLRRSPEHSTDAAASIKCAKDSWHYLTSRGRTVTRSFCPLPSRTVICQ